MHFFQIIRNRKMNSVRDVLANNFRTVYNQISKRKSCVADVHVLPLIDTAGKQRRQLAGEAEEAIRTAFESDLPSE